MRRGRHSFILGREERPLLDELKVSLPKERINLKGGHTFRVLVVLGFDG
jgi:hypothetical protein